MGSSISRLEELLARHSDNYPDDLHNWEIYGPHKEIAQGLYAPGANPALVSDSGVYLALTELKDSITIRLKPEQLQTYNIKELSSVWASDNCTSVTVECGDYTLYLENPLNPRVIGLDKLEVYKGTLKMTGNSAVMESGWFYQTKFYRSKPETSAAPASKKHPQPTTGPKTETALIDYILDLSSQQVISLRSDLTLAQCLTSNRSTPELNSSGFEFVFQLKGSISIGGAWGWNTTKFIECDHIGCACRNINIMLTSSTPIKTTDNSPVKVKKCMVVVSGDDSKPVEIDFSNFKSKHVKDGYLLFKKLNLVEWELGFTQ